MNFCATNGPKPPHTLLSRNCDEMKSILIEKQFLPDQYFLSPGNNENYQLKTE